MNKLIPIECIENKIYLIRGQKVMLDKDLSGLYLVSTKRLNEQVKRNIKRFPEDFMFRLSKEESDKIRQISRSQFATLKQGYNIKYLPFAFTENGIAMLSSVLNSEQAIQVNIQIMRTFTNLRRFLSSQKELSLNLKELGQRVDKHDSQIFAIFDAIRKMIEPKGKPAKKFGFVIEK